MLKTVHDTVVEEIRTLLEELGELPAALGSDDRLEELGMDSLRLARLMIALEGELGVDPFAEPEPGHEDEAVDVFDIHTVGEMVAAYDTALARLAAVGQSA